MQIIAHSPTDQWSRSPSEPDFSLPRLSSSVHDHAYEDLSQLAKAQRIGARSQLREIEIAFGSSCEIALSVGKKGHHGLPRRSGPRKELCSLGGKLD